MSTVVDTDRIVGFPLDSKVTGYGTDGLPVYSNAYDSGDLRVILSDMITNGIVGQDGLEVTLSEAGSSAVVATVGRGTCMVNGVLCTSRTGTLGGITAEYATADVPRKVIGYSIFVSVGDYAAEDVANVRAVRGDTTTSAPVFPEPSRTWFGYDLCIAHVIATSVWDSSANRATFSFDVIDTRMDDELCGFAAPFVDVDTTQFYAEMNNMIDNLNTATETAVELSNDALGGTLYEQIDNRLDVVEQRLDDIDPSQSDACPFPVGFVMTMIDETDPNVIYDGTTWEKIEGKFILASSAEFQTGSVGGAKTVSLTSSQIPSHKHSVGPHAHGLNSHTHGNGTLKASAGGLHKHGFTLGAWGSDWTPGQAGWSASSSKQNTYNGETSNAGSHEHAISGSTGGASGNTANSSAFDSGATGGGMGHENMPPYLVANMWKRTS